MSREQAFNSITKELKKSMGDRAYIMREAPNVKVISTGLFALDVATGIGG
jgi:RecA/RadA recombinase